jgi:hypothetical protein
MNNIGFLFVSKDWLFSGFISNLLIVPVVVILYFIINFFFSEKQRIYFRYNFALKIYFSFFYYAICLTLFYYSFEDTSKYFKVIKTINISQLIVVTWYFIIGPKYRTRQIINKYFNHVQENERVNLTVFQKTLGIDAKLVQEYAERLLENRNLDNYIEIRNSSIDKRDYFDVVNWCLNNDAIKIWHIYEFLISKNVKVKI